MTSTLTSKRIKHSRKVMNLTQEQLAEKVNTSPTNISGYENGQHTPSNKMLINLANVLEVSTDYLLGRTSQISNNDIYLDGVKITGEESVFLMKVLKALRENLKLKD